MTIEARTRRSGRAYADRGDVRGGARRYGAYTSGANALDVDLFDDAFADLDEEVVRTRRPTRVREAAVRGVDRGVVRRETASRAVGGEVRRRRVPRPRRDQPGTARPARRPATAEAAAVPVPKVAFLLLTVTLVVAGAVGVLILKTKINENSFRLGDLRQTQAALTLQEQQLAQELADLSSPGNLLEAAARLGLVPAGTPAYIDLPDGRVVGVPQPASGLPGDRDEPGPTTTGE